MINGQGGFGFLLAAKDGDLNGGGGVDGFRIELTDSLGNVVFNNVIFRRRQPDQCQYPGARAEVSASREFTLKET